MQASFYILPCISSFNPQKSPMMQILLYLHLIGKENWGKEGLTSLPKVKNKELYIISLNPPTTLISSKSYNLPSSITLILKLYPPWNTAPH